MVDMFHYWFLVPAGLVIAFLAMSAGVSGAAFLFPLYLLWLKLEVPIAFWLGLVTMLCGFGSGVYRFWRDGSYNGRLVSHYLGASVPAALAAGWVSEYVSGALLVGGFGLFALAYGAAIGIGALRDHGIDPPRRDSISYPLAIVGGAVTGLITFGIGIVALRDILRQRSIRNPGEAVGSGVMIIFVTSLAATLGRMTPTFMMVLQKDLPRIASIMIWMAPAVIIGGQIGPRFAQMLPSERHAKLYFSAVLAIVGFVTIWRGLSG